MDELAGIRPFEAADAAAIEGVLRRSFALGGPEGVTRAEHLRGIEALVAHPEQAAVAVDDGHVVGYIHPAGVLLEVDPPFRRRGHGRRLLEAGRRIAAIAGEEQLELWVPAGGPGQAFAEAVGLRYRSSFHLFRLPASRPVPAPAEVPGIVWRQLVPGADDAACAALLNVAFADHPSPMRFDLDRIAEAHARPDFDPSDILLACAAGLDGPIVGFCRATLGPIGAGPRRGEVRLVEVLPSYRRRGIGRELLRWGIGHLRGRGAVDVDLVVEALNGGALQLYRDSGFSAVAEWPRWVARTTSAR